MENNQKVNKLSIVSFVFTIFAFPAFIIGILSGFVRTVSAPSNIGLGLAIIFLLIGFIFGIISFNKIKKTNGKGKLFSIVSIITPILIVIWLGIVFFINFMQTDKEIRKLNSVASIDYCVNNTYTSDYLGLSLKCPEGLMAQEIFNGYHSTPKEGANFISKAKKIKARANNQIFFSVRLGYEKFDPNNHWEAVWRDNKLEQKEIYNFTNKVEALTGPRSVKIENIKQININGNQYYAYSFETENSRIDVFIIPQKSNYIEFVFNGQNENFIKNVLDSVKRTDDTYSNVDETNV